jgi:hypothetical protein
MGYEKTQQGELHYICSPRRVLRWSVPGAPETN